MLKDRRFSMSCEMIFRDYIRRMNIYLLVLHPPDSKRKAGFSCDNLSGMGVSESVVNLHLPTISKSLAILKNSSLESEKFIFLGHMVCLGFSNR